MQLSELLNTIGEASKGVSEATDADYRRYSLLCMQVKCLLNWTMFRLMANCEGFLIKQNLVKKGEFFSDNPGDHAAHFIAAWIMNACVRHCPSFVHCSTDHSRCDKVSLDGTKKPHTEERASYSHVQKMRASMTYAFGRVLRCGSMNWQWSESKNKMIGNPSISETVSTYMLSLRHRKVGLLLLDMSTNADVYLFQVQAGETPTSSRAITPVSKVIAFAVVLPGDRDPLL
jgi:hypothetical protein